MIAAALALVMVLVVAVVFVRRGGGGDDRGLIVVADLTSRVSVYEPDGALRGTVRLRGSEDRVKSFFRTWVEGVVLVRVDGVGWFWLDARVPDAKPIRNVTDAMQITIAGRHAFGIDYMMMTERPVVIDLRDGTSSPVEEVDDDVAVPYAAMLSPGGTRVAYRRLAEGGGVRIAEVEDLDSSREIDDAVGVFDVADDGSALVTFDEDDTLRLAVVSSDGEQRVDLDVDEPLRASFTMGGRAISVLDTDGTFTRFDLDGNRTDRTFGTGALDGGERIGDSGLAVVRDERFEVSLVNLADGEFFYLKSKEAANGEVDNTWQPAPGQVDNQRCLVLTTLRISNVAVFDREAMALEFVLLSNELLQSSVTGISRDGCTVAISSFDADVESVILRPGGDLEERGAQRVLVLSPDGSMTLERVNADDPDDVTWVVVDRDGEEGLSVDGLFATWIE
jgi:hypothetical protein